MKYAMKSKTRKTSDVRGWMALDNVTSHFSTMLEPIASASFLSSLSIIHGKTNSKTNSFREIFFKQREDKALSSLVETYLSLVV